MKRQSLSLAGALMAVLLLAACGSTGGGLGDIFGGSSPNSSTSELRGIVDSVDVNNRSITLRNVSGGNQPMLSSSGDSVRVYFDNRTSVEYQGKGYRPEDLERGDEVAVRVEQSGNNLMATQVSVLRDVSSGSGSSTYPTYSSSVRGTVRSVDTSRRTITIDRGSYDGAVTLDYDSNTYVTFNGRRYNLQDLQRGDEVEVRVRDIGGGRMVADDVTVLRSISGGTGTNTGYSTLRGTVRNVDTSRRTIELEQASWLSRFDSGTGSSGAGRVIVQYGTNTGVEVSGRVQSITGLERGDVIEVEVTNPNASTPIAQRIILVRDARQ